MSANVAQPAPSIAPNALVGGRFHVDEKVGEDALGVLFRATDTKTKKPILLRVVKAPLLSPEVNKALRGHCRIAANLAHKNIAGTYGVGMDPSGASFVASEWIEGAPLSKVISERVVAGSPMSLRGAYSVVASVCKALEFAGTKTCHGALRPSVVWVSEGGRVKVTGFGITQPLLSAHGCQVLGPQEQAAIAPEVKAGHPPTAQSDIFGLGAVLYQLLTGRSPADGFVPPSQAHPDATPAMDQILLTCLASDPAARYASPGELRAAMRSLTGGTEMPTAEDHAALEVEVDLNSMTPGQHNQVLTVPKAPKLPSDPFPVAQPAPSFLEAAPAPARPSAAQVDLGGLLAKITENDAQRWMVSKEGLDHGPFSGRELVDLILKGEVRDVHNLHNMDTGEKRDVNEWPEFTEFVEQFNLKDAKAKHETALVNAERSEKRTGVVKLAIGAGALFVIGVCGVAFWMSRDAVQEDEIKEAKLGDLYATGEIELTGSAGLLPDPPRTGKRRRRKGGGGGGGGGGFAGSYEEAMNKAVELGDVKSGGGESRLSGAQVAGVMNKHVNKLYNRCAAPEKRSGGTLGKVTIDIAIAGSGKVLGGSARPGSASFKKCINKQLRSISFPSFGAPRMGARYSFDAS